jgi:LDH2 family malate/lactate/ureidoglycolate dehydrogenase
MVGLAFTNAYPIMAPWGGRKPRLGTSPLSIAVPGGIEGGIVLDMATTMAAWGKLDLAIRAGRSIPLHWALDQNGDPAADPNQAVQLLPAGEHKGSGLNVMIEMLTAALADGDFGYRSAESRRLSQFMAAIDIGRFTPLDRFRARAEDLPPCCATRSPWPAARAASTCRGKLKPRPRPAAARRAFR